MALGEGTVENVFQWLRDLEQSSVLGIDVTDCLAAPPKEPIYPQDIHVDPALFPLQPDQEKE